MIMTEYPYSYEINVITTAWTIRFKMNTILELSNLTYTTKQEGFSQFILFEDEESLNLFKLLMA